MRVSPGKAIGANLPRSDIEAPYSLAMSGHERQGATRGGGTTAQKGEALSAFKSGVSRNFHRTRSRRVVLTELTEAQRLELEEAWGILLQISRPSSESFSRLLRPASLLTQTF